MQIMLNWAQVQRSLANIKSGSNPGIIEIMSLYNLKQHVDIQTHKQGNTLDWIMSKENLTTISGINEGDYLSDHCAIT